MNLNRLEKCSRIKASKTTQMMLLGVLKVDFEIIKLGKNTLQGFEALPTLCGPVHIP